MPRSRRDRLNFSVPLSSSFSVFSHHQANTPSRTGLQIGQGKKFVKKHGLPSSLVGGTCEPSLVILTSVSGGGSWTGKTWNRIK